MDVALQQLRAGAVPTAIDAPPYAPPNAWRQLLDIVLAALKMFPPLYVQSIFGPLWSWLPPFRSLSEFTIIDLWRLPRTVDFLVDVTVPAHSHAPGPWARTLLPPLVQHWFWRPSGYFQQPDPFDAVTSYSNERWFFLNGVATNEPVAALNSQLISAMFRRPVTVIHNQTDSLLLDLVQCAIGKSFKVNPYLTMPQTMTEPDVKATVALLETLPDPAVQRVVLLAHSQGTIITANVLRALSHAFQALRNVPERGEAALDGLDFLGRLVLPYLRPAQLDGMTQTAIDAHVTALIGKLEVYTFANCANVMSYILHVDVPGNDGTSSHTIGLPYIENFANQFDLVARLGVLSPLRSAPDSPIHIDGPLFLKTSLDAWGHLLNQHYLFGIDDYLAAPAGTVPDPYPYAGNAIPPPRPRLYGYFAGATPETPAVLQAKRKTPTYTSFGKVAV